MSTTSAIQHPFYLDAFRKEVGVERHFRDAHAATAMAPKTDALYDFISSKAICGMSLFD